MATRKNNNGIPKRYGTATVRTTNVELHPRVRTKEANAITPFATRVDVVVCCRRERLADVDNISVKAVLDGIVKSGLLQDDSSKWVRSVSVSQEKCNQGEPESTEVIITEVE